MEKPSRLIGSKFLKFLSKVAQPPVTFHSPPPSPRKASGPMIRIIPAEARRRSRNGVSFSSKPEPSSPKVSCMGQVNGKKKKKKSKNKSMTNRRACRPPQESTTCNNLISCVPNEVKRNPSKISVKVPKVTPKGSDKNIHDGFADNSVRDPKERVPSLGQMKNFASSRDALADFDLMREVLDDLKNGVCKETDEDHEKVKVNVNVPTSANKVGIKVVDLRKRRTIPPLVPLQL